MEPYRWASLVDNEITSIQPAAHLAADEVPSSANAEAQRQKLHLAATSHPPCALSSCYTSALPLIMVSSLNGMSVRYSLADNTMESPTRLDEDEEQGGLFV
ncbi:uncharacterized protein LOC125548885 [Triticum urartu]|nr:uncharacterized protein LOC125548885 [Triticum urartu]